MTQKRLLVRLLFLGSQSLRVLEALISLIVAA
jgi:hypothetical protein